MSVCVFVCRVFNCKLCVVYFISNIFISSTKRSTVENPRHWVFKVSVDQHGAVSHRICRRADWEWHVAKCSVVCRFKFNDRMLRRLASFSPSEGHLVGMRLSALPLQHLLAGRKREMNLDAAQTICFAFPASGRSTAVLILHSSWYLILVNKRSNGLHASREAARWHTRCEERDVLRLIPRASNFLHLPRGWLRSPARWFSSFFFTTRTQARSLYFCTRGT